MCCGKTRTIPLRPRIQPPVRHGTEFIYLGRTALSVTGPATGTVYHFATPGSRLRVDVRDAVALQRVPVLRAVG